MHGRRLIELVGLRCLQARLNVGRGCSKDLSNALQQAGFRFPTPILAGISRKKNMKTQEYLGPKWPKMKHYDVFLALRLEDS